MRTASSTTPSTTRPTGSSRTRYRGLVGPKNEQKQENCARCTCRRYCVEPLSRTARGEAAADDSSSCQHRSPRHRRKHESLLCFGPLSTLPISLFHLELRKCRRRRCPCLPHAPASVESIGLVQRRGTQSVFPPRPPPPPPQLLDIPPLSSLWAATLLRSHE